MYCRHRCRLYYDIDFCFKCQVCHSSHVVYEKHKLLSGFLKLFAFLALENPMIQNDCFIFSHIFSYRPFRQERACNSRLTSFFFRNLLIFSKTLHSDRNLETEKVAEIYFPEKLLLCCRIGRMTFDDLRVEYRFNAEINIG